MPGDVCEVTVIGTAVGLCSLLIVKKRIRSEDVDK